jgi:hypothetical protein
MKVKAAKIEQESWTTYLLKGVLIYFPASAAWATLSNN